MVLGALFLGAAFLAALCWLVDRWIGKMLASFDRFVEEAKEMRDKDGLA